MISARSASCCQASPYAIASETPSSEAPGAIASTIVPSSGVTNQDARVVSRDPGANGLSGPASALAVTSAFHRVRPSATRSLARRSDRHVVDLHHFVAVMVDDLDGDLARVGPRERPARRRVQARPRGLVDLGPERLLQRLVGLL